MVGNGAFCSKFAAWGRCSVPFAFCPEFRWVTFLCKNRILGSLRGPVAVEDDPRFGLAIRGRFVVFGGGVCPVSIRLFIAGSGPVERDELLLLYQLTP